MKIIVLLKMVPDVVEELKISDDGKSLDKEFIRMKLSESDEHALEQAVLLKEKYGGTVTVAALEAPELDDALYVALAKGADKAIKIVGDWSGLYAPDVAVVFSSFIEKDHIDSETLILSGSQAIDDLWGEVIYYVGELLGINSNGIVTGITIDVAQKKVRFIKEFSGGVRGEFEMNLPSILGVQAAEKPPRYVPIAKVRSIMKTIKIEEIEISQPELLSKISLNKLFEPELTGKAEMIEGNPEIVSSRLADILNEHGII